ncbi:MAG: ABC transporter permease [Acidobacteria bacterium]|nr:ABC transporter permease [Acidobacteriota bacterium]MBI3265331.1 ABC transporter permease [Acidobacteriota bacterium]
MVFVAKMALRELRASWKRLLFFFACIAIGVASIVSLRSLTQNVRVAITGQAKALTAADIVISSNRPFSSDALAKIEQRLREYSVTERTNAVQTDTMVRPATGGRAVARMVEVRGVEPAFPFYGTVVLQSGGTYAHALLQNRGLLVRPELLAQLGLKVGDALILGGAPYTIRDVVLVEPGRRLGGFSFGPPVLMDRADLLKSGLLSTFGRGRYEIMLRVPERSVAPLLGRLRRDFRDFPVGARSYRTNEDNLSEDLMRAENYLSLIGLVIVVLGGIGVSSVIRVFVQQKLKAVAVLKCVGGTNPQILAIYLAQVIALGLAGSAVGVGLAGVVVAWAPAFVGNLPPGTVEIQYELTAAAVLQGLGIGVLVSLLFSLVPLLQVRHVKPSLLLRETSVARRRDWLEIAVIALVVSALAGLAIWQAASMRVGLAVTAGFIGVTIVLHLTGRLLVRTVRPLARSRWFPLRHAVLRVGRPGNQTRAILLAVGLGSFFMIGVRLLQTNLLDSFNVQVREDGPDMFLIDIQQDQVDGVVALFTSTTPSLPPPRPIPVLRARVAGVRGREVNMESYQEVRGRGSLGREYVITYRPTLEDNETLVEGDFWSATNDGQPQVSIEVGIHERFRIMVGDIMRFEVVGRTIEARVASIRRVNWRDPRRGGFMFVFRPGTFEQAPHAYIAPAKGPDDPSVRGRLQHDLVARYPNVSVIDVSEILETVRKVVRGVTLAISVVGAIVLFSGILILVGSVSMTKFQKVYEAAIFKTLGASTRSIAGMIVLEYGALGLLAGAVGSIGALALSWTVSRFALDIPWEPSPIVNLAGIAITGMLVCGIGVTSSLDVLRRKPLATLRAE